eukprot:GHVU01014613.1.p1 GENE.GHVU01014613.1~~GHVU01014613.1.p1  ORF type:complete len:214 (+),score=37.32 GHVU01014613.1:3-644(+)
MELIAIATNGRIVPRFEDLTPEKLGSAASVKEVTVGTEKDQMVIIEGCEKQGAVTIVLRGGNKVIVDEAKRSIHDAICCVRNLVRDPRFIGGGGSSETAASIAVDEYADKVASVEQYAIRAYSNALLKPVYCLCDNCGLNAISMVADLKAEQMRTKNSKLGIDCLEEVIADMTEANIVETLASKLSQIQLATQVVKMILKIDDVIGDSDDTGY